MEEIGLVQLANEVLSKLPGGPRVTNWKDINAGLFVKLYEGLFAEALPDVIRHPKGREDQVHNIQSVIDTLSLDILNTSLSHLSGEAIVSRNKEAIKSLLEVFEWLFDYILEKIGSETSTDVGDDGATQSKLTDLEDPDLVTPEVIDSILERELGKKGMSSTDTSYNRGRSRNGRSNLSMGNSTEELIALGNTSKDYSRNGSAIDKTADLIALGNRNQYDTSPNRKHEHTTKPKTLNSTDSLLSDKYNERPHINGTSSLNMRDSERYLKAGDLGSLYVDMNDRSARLDAAGATAGFRMSPTRSSAGMDDLSTGPLSDMSDVERYTSNGTRNGSTLSASAAKETTADLIRESESIEKRLGLRPELNNTTNSITSTLHQSQQQSYNSPGIDSSMASSVSYPKPVMNEPGIRSAEFAHIGAGPAVQSGITHKDNFANSLPLGHQYHNFTHHLYHHYDPSVATSTYPRPTAQVGAGLETHLESTSTQVTPGRFLGENSIGTNNVMNSTAPVTSIADKPLTTASHSLSKTAPAKYMLSTSLQSKPSRPSNKKSYSYDNIRHLIQHTMDMSQTALENSPLRNNKKAASAVHISDDLTDDELSKRLRETLQKLHTSEDSYTDRSRTSVNDRSNTRSRVSARQENVPTQGILSPKSKKFTTVDRTNRKVSFKTSGRSSDDRTITDSELRDSHTESPLSTLVGRSLEKKTTNIAKPKYPSPRAAQYKTTYGRSAVTRKVAPKSNKSKTAKEDDISRRRTERLAKTADEYFRKYYGHGTTPSPRRSSPHQPSPRGSARSGEVTPSSRADDSLVHSDSELDYRLRDDSQDADYSGDFQAEIEEYKRQLRKRSKKVQFDDILDDSAPGHMGSIRRKLMNEEKKTRFRSEFLKDLYETELLEFESGMEDQMKKLKTTSAETTKEYKKKVLKSPKVKKQQPGTKYRAAHSSVLLPKSKAHNRTVSQGRNRKRSATVSPAVSRTGVPDNEILPWLLEQFPFLYISPETLHDMWRKSAKQVEILSKTDQYVKAKKNRAQVEIEEAENKQKLLANIAKKELKHNASMRDIEERRKQQQSVKASIRDKRLQHARVRKYYDEYHVRMRSKMLKKRSREELIFKQLFEEGLSIQKDRIRDLRKYSRDQRENRAKKQRDQLESIENLYHDRFLMLAEALEQEKQDRVIKNKAQQQVLDSLNREFRKKTETEIEAIQEQIFRDEDDEYFRQIDADRLKQELNLARYKARV